MGNKIISALSTQTRHQLDVLRPGLTDQEAETVLARLVWSQLTEPGDRTAGRLIESFGAVDALALLEDPDPMRIALTATGVNQNEIAAALKSWLPRISPEQISRTVDQALAHSMQLLTPESPAWPNQVGILGAGAPILLWATGDTAHLVSHSLAVTGARAATGYGCHVTTELTQGAVDAGLTIVAGGAYGIDAVAHRVAIVARTPSIAVLAGGLDRAYPQAHEQLFERIAESGVLVSEMAPGTPPTRWRFLARNRVIATLSAATLVTEAGMRSGSLNTAAHAAQNHRPVGAVPGPITSAASAGCHRLIQEHGATLITCTEDVLRLAGVDE